MREQWKAIKGHPGYKISNKGRVHSPAGKMLTPYDDSRGYLRVTLAGKNKKIHRMVAEHFIENPSGLPIVNHMNGNKHKNSADNLEWMTLSENTRHAWALGLIQRVRVQCG